MTASLAAVAAALTISLPILALGERIREREERRLSDQNAQPFERAAHE